MLVPLTARVRERGHTHPRDRALTRQGRVTRIGVWRYEGRDRNPPTCVDWVFARPNEGAKTWQKTSARKCFCQ